MSTRLPAAVKDLSLPTCFTSAAHVDAGSLPGPFPVQCVVLHSNFTPPALRIPRAFTVAVASSASKVTVAATLEGAACACTTPAAHAANSGASQCRVRKAREDMRPYCSALTTNERR